LGFSRAAFPSLLGVYLSIIVLVGSGVPIGAQATNPSLYQLVVDCPGVEESATGADNEILCPIRVIDAQDILGSPSVAVDPKNPDNIVFASLHGVDADGPTQRSRGNQVFTTHASTTHGADWADKPFYPPQDIQPAYGEHPQVAVDYTGHVYVGSLYSIPDDSMPSGFDYKIGAQKFESVDYVVDRQSTSGTYHLEYIEPVYSGNVIDEFWFVHDPKTDTMSVLWNDKRAPNATEGKSVIGMVWTTADHRDPYHFIKPEFEIGPCIDTTNPVLADDRIYIGCMVDTTQPGYKWDDSPEPGQIDLFRLSTPSGKPEYLGHAPIKSGNPKLGVRSDGRLFLVTAGVGADGTTRVFGAFGRFDATSNTLAWGKSRNYGPDISPAVPGVKTIDANIQDVMFREYSGVVHLLLKERFSSTTNVPILDDATDFGRPAFRKQLIAIDEKQGFLAKFDLDIGNPVNRTVFVDPTANEVPVPNAGVLSTSEDVFNDLADDLFQLPPDQYTYGDKDLGPRYQREFFAVGDYGVVIFAEIIELTTLVGPVAGPGAQAPPPNPSAALGLNVAAIGSATGGLALAGLLAYRLVLARKPTFNPSAVKQEK
jgi:hypothetical protein